MADDAQFDPLVDLRRPLVAFTRRSRRLQVLADFGGLVQQLSLAAPCAEDSMAVLRFQRCLVRAKISLDSSCAQL